MIPVSGVTVEEMLSAELKNLKELSNKIKESLDVFGELSARKCPHYIPIIDTQPHQSQCICVHPDRCQRGCGVNVCPL